ncbi:hypothetical protein SRHO_G00112460 [Serrasalmus rhombeus]
MSLASWMRWKQCLLLLSVFAISMSWYGGILDDDRGLWYHTGRECFSFTNHLVSATFLQGDRFEQYNTLSASSGNANTLKAYPVLS